MCVRVCMKAFTYVLYVKFVCTDSTFVFLFIQVLCFKRLVWLFVEFMAKSIITNTINFCPPFLPLRLNLSHLLHPPTPYCSLIWQICFKTKIVLVKVVTFQTHRWFNHQSWLRWHVYVNILKLKLRHTRTNARALIQHMLTVLAFHWIQITHVPS